MCSMCKLKKGWTYPITSPAACVSCNHEFGNTSRDLEYTGMYADTLHRFKLRYPITCPKCGEVTKVVNIACEALS